ncbi:MAG: TauD/TfdA dioxygenase family protein [Lautropia sp.]
MTLKTRTLHRAFGLEILDASIHELVNDARAMDELRHLWREAAVLVFRRQAMSEDEMVAFTSGLGRCEIVSRADILSPYRPEIIYFSTLRYADGRTVGGFAGGEEVDWHSDQTFRPNPATGAMLYGVEVPPKGGRFYWANQYLAFESLPADVRALIDGRTGRYSYAKRLGVFQASELASSVERLKREHPDVRHPVVLTHPQTGRKALYADPSTLVAIEGLDDAVNERILAQLFAAGSAPEVVCEHEMAPGDVLIWDNACVMHRRDPVDPMHARLMKRTTWRVPAEAHCLPH